METVFCVVVGLFFAASIYLMLSPRLVRILLGVSIFGNAVNLLIFTAGRLTEAAPPVLGTPRETFMPEAASAEAAGSAAIGAAGASVTAANPLPQALILTAIVISFSIFAFLLVLTFRAYQSLETDDINSMRLAEPTRAVPPLDY